jgi:endonuclease/exonuclease/phosphatase family metal-dependent hydrolase
MALSDALIFHVFEDMRSIILSLLLCFVSSGLLHSQSTLRVMTYNIKYDAVNDTENNWSVRKPWVEDVILSERPHVLGVQEALHHQVNDIRHSLKHYAYVGVGRDDGKMEGEYSALFYDSVAFTLVESGTFWLSDTPEQVSVGWDAALPRVSTFAVLENTGKQFVIYNAHLDHIGVESRRNAVGLILDHAAENFGGLPVILMGDLNFTDDDPGYSRIVNYPMTDTRNAHQVFGPKETFNGFNWDKKPEVRIDYIFYSDQFTCTTHKVVTTTFPKKYPSDHFPVLAEFIY